LRILILHSRYLSWIASGENRVVDDEASLLRAAGHEVVVWDPPFTPEGPGLLRHGVAAVWSTEAVRTFKRLVRSHRPDVVHCHNLFPTLSPAPLVTARRRHIPVVMSLHNYRLMCLPGTLLRNGKVCELCVGRAPWPGVRYRCLRGSRLGSAALAGSLVLHRRLDSFDGVDLFLAVSEFVRSKHLEAGLPPERTRLKRHFSWPASRREGPGRYFLYIGRLSREKGLATLLEGWGEVAAPLVIVGDGPDAPRLASLAGPGVEFRGAVPPEQVPRVLAGARALLVPSEWHEPAGKAILEAFASGVPVVATRMGGMPEAVRPEESGLLVEPDDPKAWTRAAETLLDDATSERLGEGAFRLWRSEYTPEAGLGALEACYRDALD
jgi:glycosyltransferase involved in cell wall biosynthesis